MGYVKDKTVSIYPTKARNRPAREEVADFEYIECEEPPDLSHGVIWAHSLGASPPDLFGEMIAWLDHQITHVKYRRPKQKGRRR